MMSLQGNTQSLSPAEAKTSFSVIAALERTWGGHSLSLYAGPETRPAQQPARPARQSSSTAAAATDIIITLSENLSDL